MNEPIEQLLRNADRSAEATTRSPSVDAIYDRAKRRRARRNVVQSLTVIAIVGASALWMLRRENASQVVQTPSHDTQESSLASLNAEIDRRELLVKKLLAIEDDTRQQIAARRRAAQRDPVDIAQQEIDNAAFAMVYQANRIAHTAGNEPAQNVYREVVAYFPDTPSAQVARERLTQ